MVDELKTLNEIDLMVLGDSKQQNDCEDILKSIGSEAINWIKEFQIERTDAISEMFDNVDENGIYPTTKFFNRIDDFWKNKFNLIEDDSKEETLFEKYPEFKEIKLLKGICHCEECQEKIKEFKEIIDKDFVRKGEAVVVGIDFAHGYETLVQAHKEGNKIIVDKIERVGFIKKQEVKEVFSELRYKFEETFAEENIETRKEDFRQQMRMYFDSADKKLGVEE